MMLSKDDQSDYADRAKCLVSQYNEEISTMKKKSETNKGELWLSENIADSAMITVSFNVCEAPILNFITLPGLSKMAQRQRHSRRTSSPTP